MFDFPASPTEGQTFTPPDAGAPTYTYKAPAWRITGTPLSLPSLPAKAAPVDADLFLLGNSEAGFANSKTAYSDLKTALNAALAFLKLTGGTLSGDLTVSKASPSHIVSKSASGQAAYFTGKMNNLNRWSQAMGDATAESGGNAGSNFVLTAYDDAGAPIGVALNIDRKTMAATLGAGLTLDAGGLLAKAPVNVGLTALSADAAGIAFLQLQNASRMWQMRLEGSSGAIALQDTSTPRMRIDTSGVMSLLGSGLKLAALSADASVLDYYGEGSWVPSLTFGGAAAGLTYTKQGYFTRIGNLVFVIGEIILSAKGTSTGGASIAGLPFPVALVISAVNIGLVSGMTGLTGALAGYGSGSTIVPLMQSAAGQGQLTDAYFTSASSMRFSMLYLTA